MVATAETVSALRPNWWGAADTPCERSLLIADDDCSTRGQLGLALSDGGFDLKFAATVEDAIAAVRRDRPAFAVVELRFGGGSGMSVVRALREERPDARIVILTGYGNIASAVAAVKAGAMDFLSKPSAPDDVAHALLATSNDPPAISDRPMSAARVRWEHIQHVLELSRGNISDAARRLSMHRRTLQRILAKRAPR